MPRRDRPVDGRRRSSSLPGAVGVVAPPVSPWRTLLGTPFLRAAFIALFISGIGVSATTPQMTLFLVDDLGSSIPVAGLYYLVNLAAPLAGYWLGGLSDRQGDRLVLFRICALVGGVGWLAMALANQIWMPFVIGALALSISGASMGQLFAAARDELSRRQSPGADRVIANLRMAFTAGWIIGPVVGSWFGAQFGLRPLLFLVAAVTAGQILPLGRLRVPRFVGSLPTDVPVDAEAVPSLPLVARRAGSRVPLFAFVGCCVLVMNGDTIKFAYLPLYMANELGVSDTVRGAVIAVQPLMEFALMPVFARLAEVFTPIRMVTVGAVFGVLANVAYATSSHVAGLFVGQLLMSALWAAIAGLGVTVAQQLYPQGVGLASSVFMSSIALSGGLGGALGGLGTALLGVPHVFFVSAVLGVGGVLGLVMTERKFRPSQSAFLPG
jgi:MFS transporter, SET family, sugar efflux transporter